MIERYMEKNLFRQLYLVEKLYEKMTISFKEMADLLEVSPRTIEKDLEQVMDTINFAIIENVHLKASYYVKINHDFPLFVLKQYFYKESLFLKVYSKFVLGQFNYLDIVDDDFISVSKAYTLKNQAMDYFRNLDLKENCGSLVLSEIEWRLITLNLMVRVDEGVEYIHPYEFEIACDELIIAIEKNFSKRIYDEDSKFYLRHGMFLAYLRKETHPIQFDPIYEAEIKKRPIYQLVKRAWDNSLFSEYLPESEMVYIAFLFNACPYTFSELEDLFKDHQEIREIFIENRPMTSELIRTFSEIAGQPLEHNIAFEQALIRLFRTAWKNYQPLIPDKIYLLTPELRKTNQIITETFIAWGKSFSINLFLDQNMINRFIEECAQFIIRKKTVVSIVIVTDSHTKFLIYQSLLKGNIFSPRIEQHIYRSLEELSQTEINYDSSIIACEKNILLKSSKEQQHLLPISLDDITSPTFARHFFELLEDILVGKSGGSE